jgi:hypothetical protein|tara:strand:- start:2907 stop:3008 length:102 start_codon:yes stop_codon:yes gene_type:complete
VISGFLKEVLNKLLLSTLTIAELSNKDTKVVID